MAKKYWWEDENQQDTQKSEAKSHWWEDSSVSSTVGTNITNRVNTWLKNHNTYISNYQTRNSGRKYNYEDSYVSDSADWLNTVSQQKSAFDAEADSILSYMDQYKDYLDADWMAQVRKTLTEARSAQDIVLGNTKKDNEWWRSFGSEEMLKAHGSAEEAYKANQRYDGYSKKYSGRKYEDIQKALKSFETNRSSEIAVMESDLSLYKELSRWEQDEKGQAKLQQLRQKYGSIDDLEKTIYEKKMAAPSEEEQWLTAYQDELYKGDSNYMSKAASGWKSYEAQKIAEWKEEESKTWFDKALESFATTPADTSLPNAGLINAQVAYANDTTYREPNDEWSTEQKNRFGYLWTEDKQKAYAYAEQVNNQINAKKKYDQQQAIGAAASDNFWSGVGHTLGAIVTAPMGIVDYLDDIAEYTARGTITQKEFVSPFEYSQAAQSGIANKLNGVDENGVAQNVLDENIPIFGGKGWGDIYSLGVSTANSMLSALAFGGAGTLVNFIGQGGAAGVDDALSRGATAEQALMYGTILGSLEGLTEMIPAEQLIKAGSSATFKNWLKKALQQGVGEFFEEGSSSFFGNLADDIIMRDKSSYNLMVKQLMQSNPGMTAEEASKIAFKQMAGDIAYDAIGGAVSGFASGGITGAVATAIDSSNLLNKENVKAKQQYGGSTDALIQEGLQNNPNSESYQLAQKYQKQVEGKKSKDGKEVKKGKELSGFQIRNLLAANQEQTVEQTKSRAKDRLKELGENASEIYTIADIVTKKVYGQELTRSEKSTLARSQFGAKVAKEMTTPTVETQSGTKAYNAKYKSLEERVGTEGRFGVSESGQATIRETNEALDIGKLEVATVGDGQMTFKVADGREVYAGDIDFADENQSFLVSAVSDIENITPAAATAIMHDVVDTSKPLGEQLNGIDEAYSYGFHGYSVADMKAGNFAPNLSNAQMMSAYKLGQSARSISDLDADAPVVKMRTSLDAKLTAEQKTAQQKARFESKDVEVYFQDGKTVVKFDEHTGKYDDKRMAAVNSAKFLSKLGIGGKYYFFESYENAAGERVYKDANGNEVAAPNGMYKDADGSIHIDLNAGNDGQGTALFTLGHELTHFVKGQSKEQFKVLGDLVKEAFDKTDLSMNDRVLAKQKFLEDIRGNAVSYTEAYEEVVADAMSTMLTDGSFHEKLMEIKVKDKGLFKAIKRFFEKMIAKFRKAYEELTPDQQDAQDIRELKDMFDRIQSAFAEALVEASDNFQAALEAEAVESLGENAKVETNAAGELLIAANERGNVQVYSERTYLEGGREKLEKALRQNGHTKEEIEKTLSYVDDALDYIKILAAGYAKNMGYTNLSNHLLADIVTNVKTGKQVMSAIVNNGDYPVNIDLSLICKKRVAYMNLMGRLIRDGVFDKVNYDGAAIAEVNEILRENGFETACLGCFVESRRLQFQTWAETIVSEWNSEVEKRNPNAGSFGFAKGKMENLTDADIDALTRELESVKKNDQGNVNLGQGNSVTRMGRLLDALPSLQKKLTVEDLLTPEGLTALRKHDGSLFSIVKSRYGAASPKIVQDFNPYASEIAMLTFAQVKGITNNAVKGAQAYVTEVKNEYGKLKKDKGESKAAFDQRKKDHEQKIQDEAMRRYLYDIGGARIQSFSDFMIENVFDYIQIFADLAAKRLPLHGYTKEIVCMRLFGMTGAKWNGSLIAHVERSMGKEYAGLLPAGTKDGIPVTVNGKDYVIGFDDYARNVATGGKSFVQSIGMKDIIALQLDPRYSPYVGNITIGVSDVQILAMLDNPLFRMVIPYHSSGMLPMFAKLVGVDLYNDYTDYQNTTVRQYYDLDGNAVSELKNAKGESVKADTSYAFNAEIQKTKDARKAADNYLNWCAQRHPVYDGSKLVGYATFNPKFSSSPYGTDFTRHKNYYKLLEDFNTYDCITEASTVQGAVTMNLPSEANRLTEQQMVEYKKALRETGIFTEKDIEKYAKKANMTFKDIIAAEVGNRANYAATQAPKWEATVKAVEAKLQKDYARDEKRSDRDYTGKQLTKEQQEFFKDSVVRDENGNLLAVYHGTDADFTVFEANKDITGEKYYFAASRTWVKNLFKEEKYHSPKNIMRVYLNIKNPLDLRSAPYVMTGNEWIDYFDSIGVPISKRFREFWSHPSKNKISFGSGKARGNITPWHIFMFDGISGGLRDTLASMGYDGLVIYDKVFSKADNTAYVAFHQNQIKLTSNKKPTTDPDTRYSVRSSKVDTDGMSAEAKKIISNLEIRARFSGISKGEYASYSAERIERELSNSSSATQMDYAKSYIAWVNPMDFLYATTTSDAGRAQIEKEAGELDLERLRKQTQPIHLTVDFETGKIVGHEGRHRMIALHKAGVEKVAVIFDAWNDDRHNTKPVDMMMIGGQEFDRYHGGLDFFVHDMLPLSKRYADAAKKLFSEVDGSIKFSERGEGTSNRHLLANAFEGISQNSIEYKMIQEYKGFIAMLNKLDEDLSAINAEIRKIRFGTEGARDMNKLRALEEKAQRIANGINRYDKRLLNMEASEPLRKVIERERKKEAQKTKDHVKEIQENKKVRAEQTELRHKIRKAIRDLDKILKHGNKQKNVKEDLLPVVTKALQSADILFTDNYGTHDMLRNGIGADLSDSEEALVKTCTRMLKDLDKMPTDGYDNWQARQEAEKRLNTQMSKLKEVFARERKRLNSIKVSSILGELADAYASLEKSEQSYVQGAYTEAVHNFLKNLQSEVGGTIVKDMTKDQLEYVYAAYKMVLTTVRKANEMFNKELKMSREQLGNAVIQEVMNAGGVHGLWTKAELAASKADWNNMKPIWVANRIGSDTFGKLMQGLFQGQYNFAVDVEEAKQFKLSMDEKYKPRSWDAEKLYEFESSTGKKFSLNLQQIMSLYAFSKREQAYSHLLNGGFVFEGNSTVIVDENGRKKTYIHNGATSYKLNEVTLNEIINSLTKEQKAYVDEMQKYLSEVMGAKGNEVSMQLYGIKMFKEQFYFPLRSSGAYMERAKEAEMKKQQGQINLVNSGFTHAVKPEAKNPIILSGFMDVWAEHCNEMSMYHSMVLPMEDFRKVYNYSTVHDDKFDSASVFQTIQDAYGDAATAYIDQLYRELNAGATIDPRETTFKKLISNFKKTAVMLSASVVVQQFSSIGRAYALIDPKYFIGTRVNSDTQLSVAEEMRKYAPVAIIKEMGGFDTGTKGSAKSYIMAEKYGNGEWLQGLKKDEQYRSDLMGILPAKADEKTWCAIWEAVKRETKAKHPKMDVKSEEFLKLAGERFSEVIEKTQVYDSVLARSANMRSKTGLMQMATSFMAEPTTTVNLLEDAIRRGDKKHMARVFGAVAVSIVLNNALASIVYAMRDDDEDETFIEKYFQSFTSGMIDDINPMSYYPFLKDVYSLFQGYDVERADMSVIADLRDALKKAISLIGKDTSGMDDDDLAKHYKTVNSAILSLLDAGCSVFGVPLKNVRRDANGIINAWNTVGKDLTERDTSWNSFWDKVGAAAKDTIPIFAWTKDEPKQDKLYEAIVSGDKAYLARLKSTYKTDSAYQSAVRKALRENDSRIHEAAQAKYEGRTEEYKRIFREIQKEGKFSFDDIMSAVNSEESAIRNKLEPDKATSSYTASDFVESIVLGDSKSAEAMKEDIIATKVANGKTQAEAEKEFISSVATGIRDAYSSGLLDEAGAENMLMEYAGKDEEEAASNVNYWAFSEAHPEYKLTESNVNDYQEFAEPAGIDLDVFVQYINGTKGLTTKYDQWGDVELTVRDQTLEVIDSLPLTWQQKDALYLAAELAESKILDVPW